MKVYSTGFLIFIKIVGSIKIVERFFFKLLRLFWHFSNAERVTILNTSRDTQCGLGEISSNINQIEKIFLCTFSLGYINQELNIGGLLFRRVIVFYRAYPYLLNCLCDCLDFINNQRPQINSPFTDFLWPRRSNVISSLTRPRIIFIS